MPDSDDSMGASDAEYDDFDSNEEFDDDVSNGGFSAADDNDDDFTVSGSHQEEPVFEYTIMRSTEIASAKQKLVEEVDKVICVGGKQAGALLQHCRWDKERLLEKYYGDKNKLFKSCGVDPNYIPSLRRSRSRGGEFRCLICYDDFTATYDAPECGHHFCQDCYAMYLQVQIESGEAECIECPDAQCKHIIDSTMVRDVLKGREEEEEMISKYSKLLSLDYVKNSKRAKWCPAPGCEYCVQVKVPEAQGVTCQCGHTWCYGCQLPHHEPIDCEMMRAWTKKCADDSETANWISAHTKECPKCKSTIQKDGGCNHMTCRSCRYEFCWVCMGDWASHGNSWYKCNVFDENKKDGEENRTESRRLLERYLHYFGRFKIHSDSSAMEDKLKDEVLSRKTELQDKDMSWIEVQFLGEAFEELRMCRRVLKSVYIFGYYAEKNNHVELMQQQQQVLEHATETLSHDLENKMGDGANMVEYRQVIVDHIALAKRVRLSLVKHTIEGREAGTLGARDSIPTL